MAAAWSLRYLVLLGGVEEKRNSKKKLRPSVNKIMFRRDDYIFFVYLTSKTLLELYIEKTNVK